MSKVPEFEILYGIHGPARNNNWEYKLSDDDKYACVDAWVYAISIEDAKSKFGKTYDYEKCSIYKLGDFQCLHLTNN